MRTGIASHHGREQFWIGPLACVLIVTGGCQNGCEKASQRPDGVSTPATGHPAAAGPGTKAHVERLAADEAWRAGTVPGVRLEFETRIRVPGFERAGEGETDSQLTRFTQTVLLSDARGRIDFTTADDYIPRGTQLRFDLARRRYVLVDPRTRRYWTLSGSEVANLQEGGPPLQRKSFEIKVTSSPARDVLAGFTASRSDAQIDFSYAFTSSSGKREGRVTAKLEIWHSADPKLREAWGDMLVAFLALPFQDQQGRKVIDELSSQIGFPLRWSMTLMQQKRPGEPQVATDDFTLVTTVTKVELRELARRALAWPPYGYQAAAEPYRFGADGQLVPAHVLARLPASDTPSPPQQETPSDADARPKSGR